VEVLVLDTRFGGPGDALLKQRRRLVDAARGAQGLADRVSRDREWVGARIVSLT
jgi:hypothetical protein